MSHNDKKTVKTPVMKQKTQFKPTPSLSKNSSHSSGESSGHKSAKENLSLKDVRLSLNLIQAAQLEIQFLYFVNHHPALYEGPVVHRAIRR